MVTRDDIARYAGVSSATVSRVINEKVHVRPEVREKVQKAIEELGYRPNKAAKSLRSNKTYNIAYIIPDIKNPYYAEVFTGINAFIASRGYMCYLIEAANTSWIDHFSSEQFDGIICAAELYDVLKNIQDELEIPVVIQGAITHQPDEYKNCLAVTHTIYEALLQGLEYLVSKGHTKIGLITRESKDNIRIKAYSEIMERYKLPFDKNLVIQFNGISYHYQIGFKCMEELLKKKTGVTAVVGNNDLICIGAMAYALKQGLRIPQDISFLGCDDTVAAMFCNPPLSTIKLYKEKQGMKAAELLLDRIEGKEVRSYTFNAALIIRESINNNKSQN